MPTTSLRLRPRSALPLAAILLAFTCAVVTACAAKDSGNDAAGAGASAQDGSTTSGNSGGHGGAGQSVNTASVTSTSSKSSTGGGGGHGGEGGHGGQAMPPCPAGTLQCDGTVQKVCDGNGGFTMMKDCAPQVCAPGLGCVTCVPGSAVCMGSTSMICKADGSGYDSTVCDPDQGVTCDAASGMCTGACAPATLGSSYIGCDYYPTVTANVVSPSPFHYAVSISNTSAMPANIKITQGLNTIVTEVVAANSVAVVDLPWVSALKDAMTTVLVPTGAYRLRSDQPVSAYQYNPLEYTLNGEFSYTNDASILLPVNAWTGNYRVAARQTLSTGLPGFYTVTASQDATTVVLTPSAVGGGVAPGAGVSATGTGTVMLNQGDVLEVFTGSQAAPGDVTGTLVAADKPVEVFGGHVCTYLPDPVCCCDHIEESIPPIESLGTDYLVTAPVVTMAPVAEVVRFIATADNTTLTYDPPQAGAPASIATAGGFVEIAGTTADFKVTASQKLLVAQYMEGGSAVGLGDPSLSLAVPIQQYRTSYLFHAPVSYSTNFVNITAPTGAAVTLDGAAVAGFQAIGASGFGVARVSLSNAGNGTHTVSSAMQVGISVYGYGQYTSYWYPGGQNLDHF